MPNRKVDSGWYRLPKSGVAYYGPVPEGADRLSDEQVTALTGEQPVEETPTPKKQTSGAPAADKAGATEGAKG